tara:strand:- start:156 stop:332 length:177 start_codon:yes stop_codon:yes gene_type:complete
MSLDLLLQLLLSVFLVKEYLDEWFSYHLHHHPLRRVIRHRHHQQQQDTPAQQVHFLVQ